MRAGFRLSHLLTQAKIPETQVQGGLKPDKGEMLSNLVRNQVQQQKKAAASPMKKKVGPQRGGSLSALVREHESFEAAAVKPVVSKAPVVPPLSFGDE